MYFSLPSLCDVLLGRLIVIVSIKGGKVNFCVGVFVSFQLAVQPLSPLSTFVFFFLRICIGTVISSYCLLFSSFASSTLTHTTFCAALLYCFFTPSIFIVCSFLLPKS